jgi:hypothetical protein
MPINTNDLRDYAGRISDPYSQFILDAASELDAARTDRNIAHEALKPFKRVANAIPNGEVIVTLNINTDTDDLTVVISADHFRKAAEILKGGAA